MKLDIYSTQVRLHPYINSGKKDKRFKSGYRTLPYAQVKTELQFDVINSERRLRMHEIIQVTTYGKYMVVAMQAGLPIATSMTGSMDTVVATLKCVRVDQMENCNAFTIPKYLDAVSLGFRVGEDQCG